MSLLSFTKSAFLVPAVVSGLWVARHPPAAASLKVAANAPAATSAPSLAQPPVIGSEPVTGPPAAPSGVNAEPTSRAPRPTSHASAGVAARRLRVERLLSTIDQITEVAVQMSPEQQLRLEPVLTDLAEQATALGDERKLRSPETDQDLDRLETIIEKLVTTLTRVVEPEVSL